MPPETIEEADPVLSSGSEWHSNPIRLHRGEIAKLTVTGQRAVYAGLFSATEYADHRNKAGTQTRFKFGSDQATVISEVHPSENDDYYLVVRNGVFTPKQKVHVRLIVEGADASQMSDDLA